METILRKEPLETVFIHFLDGRSTECKRFAVSPEAMLVPFRPENNLLTHEVVLLPSALGEYGNEPELFSDVRAFIHRYVDIPETFELISAQYVLLSWIYDAFNEVPYLRVRGDYGSGKSRFLQTVGSICYKPMFASGASTVSPLFRILDAVQGTLIIDEGDFRVSDEKAEIVKILNNGNSKGFPVLRSEISASKEVNPRAFTVFGPKLVATRRHFEDQALESRCLTESLGTRSLRSDIPITLPRSFHEEAYLLRNRLLCYRFRNLKETRGVEAHRSLEPRLSQILLPLLSTAVSEEVEAVIGEYGRRLSSSLQAFRTASLEGELLEVVIDLRRKGETLFLKRIAGDLGVRLGEPIAPRRVGWLLRHRLFLSPLRREGKTLIPEEEMEKLDLLAERYGVLPKHPKSGDVGDVGDVA